jgi:AAA+ ATPase superfamily predicted ATPase
MVDESFIPLKISEIFIGRKRELDRVEREVSERRDPDMPVVVTGVPGIGKTAVIAEFIRRFETRRQVIWIRCSEFEQTAPAFEEAMRSRFEDRSLREVIVVLDGADEIFRGTVRDGSPPRQECGPGDWKPTATELRKAKITVEETFSKTRKKMKRNKKQE